ncbi:site-specific integrase [Mycobacterium sp.]|uniref:site-specific integrase n=1 Tax=Mycobacterium sp. TaxID=1785 RepID=UPI003F9A6427
MTDPTKRTRRSEPITKRTARNGSTTYEFRIAIGTLPDGSRLRKRYTFRTQAEARRELRRISTEVGSGTYTAPARITVADACEQWLDGKRNVRSVTVEGYRFALLHATRRFGAVPLQSLTKAQLDEMVSEMLTSGSRHGGPLSVRSVQFAVRTLRAVIEDARRQGLVARNVADLVEVPRSTRRKIVTWSATEAQQFAEHVRGERLAACWALTLAGLRRSEVLGLAWSAVDFDAGTVSVVASRVAVGSGRETVIGPPKSARGRRILPMPPATMAALRALKTRQKGEYLALGVPWSDANLIAVREDGVPIRPEHYSDEFARLCAAAGVPVIRLHDARHTSVSLAIDAGHNLAAVADWHGHSPAEMLATYSHSQRDALRAIGSTMPGSDSAAR